MYEEIEKIIAEGKELTEEQKKLLKERGIFEEKKAPKETPLPDPEIEKALKKINPIKIYINTSTGKLEFLEEMSVEEYKEIKRRYVKKLIKIYEYLKEGKTHGVYCLCPLCLFQFHKLTHKNSKIREENFLLGLLLILNAKFIEKNGKKIPKHNWKLVNDLMFQITGNTKYFEDYCSYEERNKKYKVGSRYRKIFLKAYSEKKRLIYSTSKHGQNVGTLIYSKAYLQAVKKTIEMDGKLRNTIFNYIKKNEKITLRQLERRFPKLRVKDLVYYLDIFRDEGVIQWNQHQKYIYSTGKDKQIIRNHWDKIIREIKKSLI